MNYTFTRVASFCGLRLSYYSTAALIFISFLALAVTEYRSASPLYILLTMAVLPAIAETLFFSKQKTKKRENGLSFPLFCAKYHYNEIKFKSMKIAYLLVFILLAAWHISYTNYTTAPAFIRTLPAILAASSLLLRVLVTLGYRLYFHFFPFKAMH